MPEGEKINLNFARLLIKLEKARKKLSDADFGDKKRLLTASQEVDRLIVEYYRAKFDFKVVEPVLLDSLRKR